MPLIDELRDVYHAFCKGASREDPGAELVVPKSRTTNRRSPISEPLQWKRPEANATLADVCSWLHAPSRYTHNPASPNPTTISSRPSPVRSATTSAWAENGCSCAQSPLFM